MKALSPREREVVVLLAQGLTRAEVGRRLGITRSTVNTHGHYAYVKLGVHTAREALLVCARQGMIDFEQGVPEPPTDELELLRKLLALTRTLISALDDGRRPRRRQMRSPAIVSYMAALDALLAARRNVAARDEAREQMADALGIAPGADRRRPREGVLGALITEVLDS